MTVIRALSINGSNHNWHTTHRHIHSTHRHMENTHRHMRNSHLDVRNTSARKELTCRTSTHRQEDTNVECLSIKSKIVKEIIISEPEKCSDLLITECNGWHIIMWLKIWFSRDLEASTSKLLENIEYICITHMYHTYESHICITHMYHTYIDVSSRF